MILVDTSVLVDYFKNTENEKSLLFDDIIRKEIPFCISCLTYQELLQGARDEGEFEILKSYLSMQIIYPVPQEVYFFEDCAKMYFDLRRIGKTIRSSVDVVIAKTALEFDLLLLHNDKDFDVIAETFKNLKIVSKIEDLD